MDTRPTAGVVPEQEGPHRERVWCVNCESDIMPQAATGSIGGSGAAGTKRSNVRADLHARGGCMVEIEIQGCLVR